MTTVPPQSPEPQRRPDRAGSAPLTIRGRNQLRWILIRCWIRLLVRPRPRKRARGALVPGELMIAAPARAQIDTVLDQVATRFGRLTPARSTFARPAPRETSDGLGAQQLVPLRYRYARVTCRPGTERYLARAIRVVARSLRIGGFDVHVVQSMWLVQNAEPVPSGEIVFDDSFLADIERLRTSNCRGAGVRVLVVDRMMPAQLCGSVGVVADGHGTLMYEIVRTVAPGAWLDAVAVGPQHEASSWSLLEAVAEHRDADVLVVSLSLEAGGKGKLAADRRAFMARWLNDVTRSPLRPIVVLPTGNAGHSEPIDELAIPGRFEAAVTIGAITPTGHRASGSRYGPKEGAARYEWWVAPGGDFDIVGVQAACATMGGVPQAGTSVANAVAGGMIACLIEELRATRVLAAPPPDEQDVLDRLADAMPTASRERSEFLRLLQDASLSARGDVTRWTIVTALRNRCESIADQDQTRVGLGRLRV